MNGLVTNITLSTKATDIENKIPDVTNLATKAALNTKATEIQRKYLMLVLWKRTPKLLKLKIKYQMLVILRQK